MPNKEIQIVISGLHPGEKLFEELRYDKEGVDSTLHEGIFVTKLENIDRKKFDKALAELGALAYAEDEDGVEKKVFCIVPSEAREQALREREASLRSAEAEAKMLEEEKAKQQAEKSVTGRKNPSLVRNGLDADRVAQ